MIRQPAIEKISWQERKFWISKIWSHYEEAKNNAKLYPTRFWDCVCGTIALILNRENEDIVSWDWYDRKEDIAWANHTRGFNGEYTTEDWDYLTVSGFQFFIGHDGCS